MTSEHKPWVAPSNWRWAAGMRVIVTQEAKRFFGFVVWVGKTTLEIAVDGHRSTKLFVHEVIEPALDHPATRGCLLELVRQVWDDPGIVTQSLHRLFDDQKVVSQWVLVTSKDHFDMRHSMVTPKDTEHGLLIAALGKKQSKT